MIISRIHRPLRERLVICFLMALGLLATAATLPKLVSVAKFGFKGDLTYRASDALLWSSLEVNLGIIAACVPTLRAPFETALRRCGWIRSSQIGPELESLEATRTGVKRRDSSALSGFPKDDENFFVVADEKHLVEASWLEIDADFTSRRTER